MMNCLNPNKTHENMVARSTSTDGPTIVLSNASTTKASVEVEQQATCHFCKYLLQGALLGDCRVTRLIGSGAFGDVYEAEQLPPLNRRVAIKVMSLDRVADGQSAELFAREVGAIAALDHPNILPVLHAGSLEDGRSYLVMKYAAHGSLQNYCQLTPQNLSIMPTTTPASVDAYSTRELDEYEQEDDTNDHAVKPDKPDSGESSVLTPQQILPYVEGAAAALQHAHDNGIIHLDVKPANLLLDGEDRIMLADFGVSALLDGYTHASLHGYVGTPVYTPPEQWMEQPRAASDQYALAVTCFQLLTGRAPFMGNLYSIMHGHLQTASPPLREFNPLIPSQVEAVILRALAKEPEDRYKDMLAFACAYREALTDAASSKTDDQRHISASQAAEQPIDLAGASTLDLVAASTISSDNSLFQEKLNQAEEQKSRQTSVIEGEFTPVKTAWEPPEVKSRFPVGKKMGRIVGLALLVLFLVSGSMLGVMRVVNPCLLGICPAMKLSTSEVDFVNNDSQPVKISNTGTADLHWSASIQGNASWLAIAPSAGSLIPGKTTTFTIATNANTMPNGINTALVQVSGQGLNPQNILVKLTVLTGLSQIGVKISGKSFSYSQGSLQPPSQTITITNKSLLAFTWSIQYGESNSWLVVTPDQGSVNANASATLKMTVNPQNLVSHTYQTSISLIGKLESQPEPGLVSTFDVLLKVDQSGQTVTPVITPTIPQQTFNFTAQSVNSTGAPATLRSNHSMVWDSQDNLLFVFGGIDDQGNLLNDLWSFSPATQTWKEANASTATTGLCNNSKIPAPRMNAAMVWDSVDQQLLLYGGLGANNHYLGDLWSYSPTAGTWTALSCSGNPPGMRSTNAVWTGSQILLLGGANTYGLLSDFWSYTPANAGGAWQKLTDSPMGQRELQTMVWNSTNNQLYVFGGLGVTGQQQKDFYVYSANSGWTQITPKSANNPPPRQQGMGAWDSKDNLMLLIGGWEDGQGVPYWGLWAFDPKQDAWGLLTPLNSAGAHTIPGRTAAVMAWDATDQHAYIYAGAGAGKTGSTLNDLWMVTS